VATVLIISSIVKRLLWRASPLAGGGRFYSGGQAPLPPSPTGAGAAHHDSSSHVAYWAFQWFSHLLVWPTVLQWQWQWRIQTSVGTQPPAGSKNSPWWEVRGAKSPKAEHFCILLHCVSCTPVASFTCTDLPDYWHSSRLRVWSSPSALIYW